jgi:hypothetical protein
MSGMKYLFASLDALIAEIAWEVVKDGHDFKPFVIRGEKPWFLDHCLEECLSAA